MSADRAKLRVIADMNRASPLVPVVQANVRLMVDAEHSYFQPAINHAVTELQRTYNRHKPTVLNTYQCYLQARLPSSLSCAVMLELHRVSVDFGERKCGAVCRWTWTLEVKLFTGLFPWLLFKSWEAALQNVLFCGYCVMSVCVMSGKPEKSLHGGHGQCTH